MRFSILTLLGLVAIAGASCAALLNSSYALGRVFVTACFLVLLTSFLGIIYRSDQRRAFWVGFAIFGWGYFMAYWGIVINGISGELAPGIAIEYAARQLSDTLPHEGRRFSGNAKDSRPFRTIGHSLANLVVAMGGGWLGWYFYAHGERKTDPPLSKESFD